MAGIARHRADEPREQLHDYVRRLADDLRSAARSGTDGPLRGELLRLRSDFARLAYTAREDSCAPPRVADLLDMFATLAQRTAYLTGSSDWTGDHVEEHGSALVALADLTDELNVALRLESAEACEALLPKARALLARTQVREDRFRIFFQGYLNLVILILRTAADPRQRPWRLTPRGLARVAVFRKRPSLDSFEMRFAVRCGAVLAVSCTTNLLFPVEKLYWSRSTRSCCCSPSRASPCGACARAWSEPSSDASSCTPWRCSTSTTWASPFWAWCSWLRSTPRRQAR